MNQLLKQQEWRAFDQTTNDAASDAKASFAIDDVLCGSVGKGESAPIIRAWVHDDTISLGIQDTRLPYLQEGLKFLEKRGYQYIARNSGGLAVVLDSGVLNLSLIFAENVNRISIDEGFLAMVSLVKDMLAPYKLDIEAREIEHSYCPGRYDLSVGGKKFAGISQRRLRKGVAVQIYLCVNGSGSERAELIRDFYKVSLGDAEDTAKYPDIWPDVMASLSELYGNEISMTQLMQDLYRAIGPYGAIIPSSLTEEEMERFPADYERMIERNKKAFG